MRPETAAAVMAEREACAAVCDFLKDEWLKDSVRHNDVRFNMAGGAWRIRAAIRARPAPVVEPAGDGWQPIETAPFGKVVILGWWGSIGRQRVAIEDAAWGWCDQAGADRTRCHAWATHWRPLPDPPALADLQRAEG